MGEDRTGVEWDPHAYVTVSTPQQEWALDLLRRIRLRGDETVIDLGCGAGLVASALAELVPRCQVVAVDASEAMVRAATERLGPNARAVLADIATFTWPEPADLVVSTAALHWVPDHSNLWRRLHDLLRPGGALAVQYGGSGNIPGVEDALRAVAGREPFAQHLEPFASPWTFDTPAIADQQLRDAGFLDINIWDRAQASPTARHACLHPHRRRGRCCRSAACRPSGAL